MKKFIFILLIIYNTYAVWLVKINKNEIVISKDDFLTAISAADQGKLRDLDYKHDLLNMYIDHRIIIAEAKKKGYTKEHKEIKEQFEENKDLILIQAYIEQIIPFNQEKFMQNFEKNYKETDAKAFYSEFRKLSGDKRTYNELTLKEKQTIKQRILLEKSQELLEKLKNKYSNKIETDYKKRKGKNLVKRYELNNLIVARVGKREITQAEVTKNLNNQLGILNVSGAKLKKEQPKEYNEYMHKIREELILQRIVEIEMTKNNFIATRGAKNKLNQLLDTLIINRFREDILDQNEITDEEINNAYEQNKELFANEADQEKIYKVLKRELQKDKSEKTLKRIVQRIRDGSRIEKNEEEIKKMR